MRLDTLEKRMLYYRDMTNYKLIPNSYVIIMLDGRSFSKYCKRFEKPYDKDFINAMNDTAAYLCANVEGCKFAYVQSDEISLVVTDFDTPETESWFGYRLTKILPISASLASTKFNQLMTIDYIEKYRPSVDTILNKLSENKLAEFDAKAWNVPTYNDVFAWFLFRQIDCVRNSKQMAAQNEFSHEELKGVDTDTQIAMLKEKKGIDWHACDEGMKYGRFITRESVIINEGCENECVRNKWIAKAAFPLFEENGRKNFDNLNIIPKL